MSNIITQYKNGNIDITVFDDGTKFREFDKIPKPQFPELISIRITNKCDIGCKHCCCNVDEKHSNLALLKPFLNLIPGTEINIDCGLILTHPHLIPFLEDIVKKGFLPSINIHAKHLLNNSAVSLLSKVKLFELNILYSKDADLNNILYAFNYCNNVKFVLDISNSELSYINDIILFCANNKLKCNIFIKGSQFYIDGWEDIEKYFNNNISLCFDNLALRQLNISKFFTRESWDNLMKINQGSNIVKLSIENMNVKIG